MRKMKLLLVAVLCAPVASADAGLPATQASQQYRWILAQSEGPTIGPGGNVNCPWVPTQVQNPDAGHCGYNDLSIPNPAIYECGNVIQGNQCVPSCRFVRCDGP